MPEIDHIGKYEIRREIGRGAMGVVYEAYDPMIKRVVALKTIRRDQLTDEDSAQMINRFRREAQAAGRLNHPNIVSIYDFGEEGGIWYIAMEFVQGRELKACFEANERFRIPDIVRIMKQILGALDYSHKQGVIHRDVKPANIFLLTDGSVKVGDFGIAHIEASNLTQVGTVLGTPSYMSPEQILGLPVDGRSDLFSAGVILYQFLTGERPFSGSSTTTMQKVLKEDPLPPSSLNVQVLPVMDAVVRKALAKHADERYQTAQEFIDAIEAAAQAAGGGAGVTLPGVRAGSTDATVMATPEATATATRTATIPPRPVPPPPLTTTSAGPPPTPSRVPPGAIVAVAVAVALGASAWFAWQRFGPDITHTAQAPASATPPSPVAPPAPAKAPAPLPVATPGTVTISAVGLVDPADPRYKGDKALQQDDARADAKSQVVAKALGLLLDSKSLAKHYDLLKTKLLSNSGAYIETVVRESEPRVGKDGLMAVTTEAVVNVKALQKSLNQMTRDERVEIIRANGDPKVSVQVTVRDSDQPDAPPQTSPVAENILKERIKTFGFRTWAEGAPEGKAGADFAVRGEAKVKKLSARLEASGLPGDQVHADVVDGEVRRPRDRRGDLLQHGAADERRQLEQRGGGAEGDRREDRRRVLARLLPAARERVEPEDRARHRRLARRGDRGRGRPRVPRAAAGHRRVRAPRREAACLRRPARRHGRRGRSRRRRDPEAAQRQARPAVLRARRSQRRQRSRRVRQGVRRRCRSVTARDESAGRPLRRAARAPEERDQGSGHVQEADDLNRPAVIPAQAGPSDVRRRTLGFRFAGTTASFVIAPVQLPVARDEGVAQNLGRVGGVRVAEADVAAPAQHQLLAAELDLALAVDRHEGPVRALVDQHELVAPALDPRVHAARRAGRRSRRRSAHRGRSPPP